MNYKLFKKVYTVLVTIGLVLSSCEKGTDSDITYQPTIISINTPKISDPVSDDIIASNKLITKDEDSKQEEVIALGDGTYLIASLEKVSNLNRTKELLADASAPGTTLPPVNSHLEADVKYMLLVYSEDGNLLEEREYTAGKEASAPALTLSGGRKFIFVSYSTNSKTLPVVIDKSLLSTAKVEGATEDLMYYKEEIFIKPGVENKINIVLSHKFTAVTTTLKLTESTDAIGKTVGNIYNINDLKFSNLSESGGIKLADGTVTYTPVSESVSRLAAMPESSTPVRSITSKETILIAPAGNITKLSIPAITLTDGMNEYTQAIDRIALSSIKIVPGHKYNLVIKIYKPCTELVDTKFVYSYFLEKPSGTEEGTQTPLQTINVSSADFGYTLDILALDNSFDMAINNVKIASSELQFEGGISGLPKNVRFAGGLSDYGSGGVPQIYNMYPHGKATNEAYPVVRIVVPAATGKVQLFGSRKEGGPLYPLELYNGITLKEVTWNKTGANKITFSQKRKGQTEMIIRGYGRKIVNCN